MTEAQCPTCERDDFKSETGMKQHHAKVHGESIPGKLVECSVCGEEMREERRHRAEEQENFFCSDTCLSEFMSGRDGEDHPCYERSLVACEWCGEGVERTPSELENTDNVFCSRRCHARYQSENRTGDWSHLWNGGKIETECANCGAEIERIPCQYEKYENHFCDIQCEGEFRSVESPEPWHEYGEMWEDRREQRLELDDYECQVCGMSEEEHMDQCDRGLHIHHRKPFREFDEPKVANRLDNLVALCCSCHRRVEENEASV